MSRRLKSLQEVLTRLSSLSLPQVLSSLARQAFQNKVEVLLRRVEDSFHHTLTSHLCEHSIHLNSRLLALQDQLHQAKRAHSDFENATRGERVAEKFESLLEELQRSTQDLRVLQKAREAEIEFTFDEEKLAELVVSQMSYSLKIGDQAIIETEGDSEKSRRQKALEKQLQEEERARGELWEELETFKAKYAIIQEHIKNKNKEPQQNLQGSVKRMISLYCHKGRRSSLRATRSRSKDANSPSGQHFHRSPESSQVPELPLIDSPQKAKTCKTSYPSNRPRGARAGPSREAKPEEEKAHSFVSYPSLKESNGKKGGVGFLQTIGNWKIVNSKAYGAHRNLTKIEEEIGGGIRVPPLR